MFVINNIRIYKTYLAVTMFDFKAKYTLTNYFTEQLEYQQGLLVFILNRVIRHY